MISKHDLTALIETWRTIAADREGDSHYRGGVKYCADALSAALAAGACAVPETQEGERVVMTITVEKSSDGYACLAQTDGGKIGIGTGDSSTLVGALAELCETLIKAAEDESKEIPEPLPAVPVQDAPHLCAGCGHRWNASTTTGELCGDCWRIAQSVLQPAAPAAPAVQLHRAAGEKP